jgi:hypothetical protein
VAYSDEFDLTNDPEFRGRVGMCVAEQAKVFVNDERPEFYQLANVAIGDYRVVADQMMPLVATQPGMSNTATDGDILSAVQSLWPVVGKRLVPPPPISYPATP